MKHLFRSTILVALMLIAGYVNAQQATQRLAVRILGDKASNFEFVVAKMGTQADAFRLEDANGKIRITANNDNALAMGLNYYLRHYAHVHVSWFANEPVDPLKKLTPIGDSPVTLTCAVDDRFFLNYCTYGYTMPWWGWNEWERFIDWMALNGINMPLALTGQEAVWYEVWKDFGMSDLEIRNFFSGPAHLPWHRMANLDGFQGPLPMPFIESQKELQTKILAREHELNMRPVLPAFAGHIPSQIAASHPECDVKRLSPWCGFESTYFLNPNDPLFAEIQAAFINKQTELYGTDHLYGLDPFNEMDPPSWDEQYLFDVSTNIYHALQNVDPKAQWVQMGWIFYYKSKQWTNSRVQKYLEGSPKNGLILLDYFCEKAVVSQQTEQFFGYPYIWCYLGNFGGNTMLVGDLNQLNEKLEDAFAANGNMVGIGSTLEAFDCSPQIYEFLFERAWDRTTTVDQWVSNWATMRVGDVKQASQDAWQLLNKEVYKDWSFYGKGTQMVARPTFKGHGTYYTKTEYSYSNDSLLKACQLLLKSPSKRDGYKYDLVNLYSQWLGNYFNEVRDTFTEAYTNRDVEAMKAAKDKANTIIDFADELLSTHPSFMLGKWIEDARAMGNTPEEKDYYETNARTLLTIWGGPVLNDYANRMWGGLVKDYYAQRWNLFFDAAIQAVEKGSTVDEDQFSQALSVFEHQWTEQHNSFPAQAQGKTVKVAKKLNRWIDKNL